MDSKGSVTVIAGCMYAGKSEALLHRLRRVQLAKKPFLLFKPSIDDRYSKTEVVSHSGYRMEAHSILPGAKGSMDEHEAILSLWHEKDCPRVVGFDEAQFFNALHAPVESLVAKGVHVTLAGLDLDYRGYPFLDPVFFSVAEEVIKLTAVCMTCGHPASRTQRVSGGESLVEVGGTGHYEARCRTHWTGKTTG